MKDTFTDLKLEAIIGVDPLSLNDVFTRLASDIRQIVEDSPEAPGKVRNPIVLRVAIETSLASNGFVPLSPIGVTIDEDGSLHFSHE